MQKTLQQYQPPTLEQYPSYTVLTGVSLPIGTTLLPDGADVLDLSQDLFEVNQ